MTTLSVEALDALVHSVIVTIWTAAIVAFIVGAWLLTRHQGTHRSPLQAADTGHQPAHARPVQPSRLTRAVDAWLSGWRDLAPAHALLRGGLL